MKNSNAGRYAIVGVTALALAGCFGGSGSDGGGGGGGSSLESLPDVESQVMSSSGDGLTYTQAVQSQGAECGDKTADRYLETSKALIYGDTDVSEDRLQLIANGVHHYYDKALSGMGLESDSFDNTRLITVAKAFIESNIDTPDWSHTQQALSEEVSFDGAIESSTDAMRELLKLTPDELERVVDRAFKLSGTSKKDASMFYMGGTDGMEEYSYRYEPEKIVTCVDSSVDSSTGTGLFSGILVGKKPRPDIVEHELVHYVQNRLIGDNAYTHAPRWFTEGQAVSVSDQSIAGEGDLGALNPITMESYEDEEGYDIGLAYRLYGLAYEYGAESTSSDKLNDLLKNSFVSSPERQEQSVSLEQFKQEFSSRVTAPQGESLDYNNFQSTWESRALDYIQ